MSTEIEQFTNATKVITNVIHHSTQSVMSLLEGKMTDTTIDLGTHEMIISTREKQLPPPIPEELKK